MASTATKTPPTTDVELKLDGSLAQPLFKAARIIAAFASRDDARAVLTAVRLQSDGKRLRIEATDSYRLARLDLKGFDGTDEFDILVNARWLVANLPKGNLSPAEQFTVEITERRFEVRDLIAGSAASIPLVGGEYPNTSSIIDRDEPPEMDGETERAFRPQFLASVFKAADQFGDDATPIRIRHLNPMAPCHFRVESGDGTLTMLLMPVRVS